MSDHVDLSQLSRRCVRSGCWRKAEPGKSFCSYGCETEFFGANRARPATQRQSCPLPLQQPCQWWDESTCATHRRHADERTPTIASRPSPLADAAPPGSAVWMLVHEVEYDTDVLAFSSQAAAVEHAASLARDGWGSIAGCEGVPASPPDADAEAMAIYFDNRDEESCTIEQVIVGA